MSMQCHPSFNMASCHLQQSPTRIHHSWCSTWKNAASAYLLVQNPLASCDPLVACHPHQTTWAIKKRIVKQGEPLEDHIVKPSGPKRSILLHLSSCSHHDIIVCFSPKPPVGLMHNKAVNRNNAMLRTSQQPQSSKLFLRMSPPPPPKPPPPKAAAGHPPVQFVFNVTVSQYIQHPLHAAW